MKPARLSTLLTAALLALFCAAAQSQEARIIILEQPETDHLKSLYTEYQDAHQRFLHAKDEAARKHGLGSWVTELSMDFRAMVVASTPGKDVGGYITIQQHFDPQHIDIFDHTPVTFRQGPSVEDHGISVDDRRSQ